MKAGMLIALCSFALTAALFRSTSEGEAVKIYRRPSRDTITAIAADFEKPHATRSPSFRHGGARNRGSGIPKLHC